jgi:ABC-type transport system involved in multi-copper enzyme maturation permease subunit
VASVTFTPAPAEEAIPGIVQSQAFRQTFADRGKSVIPVMVLVAYEVKNLKALTQQTNPSARDHVLDLVVKERSPHGFDNVVHTWLHKPDLKGGIFKGPEFGASTFRVTDDEMAEYLKNQFYIAGNLEVSEIKRITGAPADANAALPGPNTFTFRVTTKGSSGVRGWPHNVGLFFGLWTLPDVFRASLGKCVFFIENYMIGGIGAWIATLVGVVITAFFIPNMLRKGTIDMLLVKPIHRPTLLIYKYIGGLAFVLLNSTIAIGGTWLVLGLRSGIWAPGFLLTILSLTFFFAILYSVSALLAVLTRSAIVAILVTCFVSFVFGLVGLGYQNLAAVQKDEILAKQFHDSGWGWLFVVADVVHAVLPRTSDLNVLEDKLIAQCLTESERRALRFDLLPDVNWGDTLLFSSIFIGVMLGIACIRFHFKDY